MRKDEKMNEARWKVGEMRKEMNDWKWMRCQEWDDEKWWKNEWGKVPLTESVIFGEMDEAMKMMNEPQTPQPPPRKTSTATNKRWTST